MRVIICLICIVFAAATRAQEANATWVFLNTGPDRAKTKGMAEAELKKMQADHVGNFGVQFDQGRLLAAGPLGDNGFIRGTVILSVVKPEDIKECFKPDPFIQNKILEAETHPWLVDLMRFGSPVIPFKITQHTICIVKKAKNWKPSRSSRTADAMLRLFPSQKRNAASGELAVSGPFLDDGDKLGLLVFFTNNWTALSAELSKEPAVKDGLVEFEMHPQYLGVGTFRKPAQSYAPPKSGKRLKLFDGASFAGWEGDTQGTWRIEKGALIGGHLTQTVLHNEFLCTTKEFQNFDLRLKVKLAGTGFVNGGVQIRSQRTKDPTYEMAGYQADMGEGYWGSLYDESRRNKTLAHPHAVQMKYILKPNDWNEYVIRCEGPHIRLWLNGVLTVDYTEDDKDIPLAGFIGLQIHGGGKAEASYNDISIEELP